MPQSGTGLDKDFKEQIEAFKMKQHETKIPWMLMEIQKNDVGIEVVKVTKKAQPHDNLETLREELKTRDAVYFVLDYEPSEEQITKYNIPKNKNFPLTCCWTKETAKVADKMKYSSTVGTVKAATNTLKAYLEAHDFDDISDDAVWEKVKKLY